MAAQKLELDQLQVDTFSLVEPENDLYIDDSYTGFYGGACISLPPNCLQTGRKCI
jgi:hypothetical protein